MTNLKAGGAGEYQDLYYEALAVLVKAGERARRAEQLIARVREAADKYAGARWRDTPSLSIEYAEGLNQAGDEILDILDGDK